MKLQPLLRSAALLALAAAATPAGAQRANTAEARTARYLESIREQPPQLTAFLREMPKGGDLHSHLSGAVYAERFLEWAAEDGLCVNKNALAIVGPCTPSGDTLVAAAQAVRDNTLYGQLVDAMSMRNWNPARINGHDQFFATFGKLNSTDRRTGDMVADAAQRAALGRVRYLELMFTPDRRAARELGRAVQQAERNPLVDDVSFARFREQLLARGLGQVARAAGARIDSVEARRDTVLGCRTPREQPGCGVTVRWLYQVSRANPPEEVFAQILTGFLLADQDESVVGLNLVQPEDYLVAMRDYSLQMRMIRYLRGVYPRVPVTLHAGELAPGLVPPDGLRFHIREAVEVAGARRVGHGVDVMHEERPADLLRDMAVRGVMVEIALTSNDVILGVRGKDHPLHAYLAAGVPVALATDDEGVARSEMTMEYLKAVRDQGLDYRTLKAMARTSLEHAFIGGESLWRDGRSFTPVAACAGGMDADACRQLAERSPRARLQADLERAFADFERRVAAMAPAGTTSRSGR